jgi:uncharacterized protein YuzE
MNNRYLKITFRKGKPIAAYLHLPRDPGVNSARTEPMGKGLLADYSHDGKLIGVEITAPTSVTPAEINAALARMGQPALDPEELAPLAA